jgi:hypothetical protein
MEQDAEYTTVIFRKESGGDILAVFPYLMADRDGNPSCYAHVGQHGGCRWEYVTQRTKPAKPSEYADLKAELESIGYRLDVKKRRSHKMWSRAYDDMLDRRRQAEQTRQGVRDYLSRDGAWDMRKVTIDASSEEEARQLCLDNCGFWPDAVREVDAGSDGNRAYMCFESALDAELWDKQT